MKLKAWLKDNKDLFRDNDLRFIIKNINAKEVSLSSESDAALSAEDLLYLDKIKQMYIKGVPLSYILGKEEFFGLEFTVDSRVLIPRPETELIVEKALELINKNNLYYILDLCTGSGNIAISIKKSVDRESLVFACDIDSGAISLAGINRELHKADIKLIRSDLLDGFKPKSFDLIVSNPPYVESDNINGTLNFEPKVALDGGCDGLLFIKKILMQAHKYLKNEGYLILEIGYNYRDSSERVISQLGHYQIKEWIKDYSNSWRGVILKKASS